MFDRLVDALNLAVSLCEKRGIQDRELDEVRRVLDRARRYKAVRE